MPSRAVSLIDLAVHELRTPLTVAAGSLRQLSGLADPVQQAAVARALRSCERLEQLTAQMRDWARLEESPPVPGSVKLDEILRGAGRAAAVARGGEVALVVNGVPDVTVQALPHLVSGAVATLLEAVIRAAGFGEAVEVDAAVAGDDVTVVARRSGAEPVEATETFQAEWLGGVGFSLPLSRAIIAAGGGTVTSTHGADGRLNAVIVRLAALPLAPR